MQLHHTLWAAMLLACATTSAYSQTPVKMSEQTGLIFTENFDDIHNWQDNFSAGQGATHWKSAGVNSAGTIPDGVTTTISTGTFASTYLGSGVHRSPNTAEPARFLDFLVNGTTDNTDALAVDFYMDFTDVNADHLSFDAATVNNGVVTSNRVSTLKIYYSIDGSTFTILPGAFYIAVNYSSTPTNVSVSLPAQFNSATTAILRFYVSNGTGGDNGSRPHITIDNLTITATAVLPVALRSFTAQKIKNNVLLKWITASEQHSDHFEVQRSYNGNTFTPIASIVANGDTDSLSSYQFIDAPYPYHQIYYRLKIIDIDGKFSYSRVISLSNVFDGVMQLFPNPAHNQIMLQWNMPAEHRTLIQIVNASGQMQRSQYLQPGNSQLIIPINNLSAGKYWIKIMDGNSTQAISFIRQ